MSYKLKLLSLVASDIKTAKERYSDIRPGLGEDFNLWSKKRLNDSGGTHVHTP